MARVSHLCAYLVACAILSGASAAGAATLYSWSGECTSGCSGTATGELMIKNGADATSLTTADFVSWSYASDQFSIAFSATDIVDPAVFDVTGDLTLNTFKIDVQTFLPNPDFDYLFDTDGTDWASLNFLSGQSDSGDRSRLSLVPLPASLPLFAAGLAGLAIIRLRRKRTAGGPAPATRG